MQTISATLSALELGEATVRGRLAVYPLTGADAPGPDYLTLDEALAAGVLRVTEISAGGVVPELKVSNSGERPVLLLDGEQLVGAKQNRILNLSILVPARAELAIPVSCVESGRWHYRSENFAASKSAAFASLRAAKAAQVSESLAFGRERRSNQARVWDEIAAKMARMEASSPTSAMDDVFARSERDMQVLEAELPEIAGQRGAVFAVGERIAGLDLFDRAATFSRYRGKLVRSYGLDALDPDARGEPADRTSARRFLDGLRLAAVQRYPAVGLGEDLRLSGLALCGAALAAGDALVHLCAFARPTGAREDDPEQAPRASWSRRRHGLH